VVQDQKNREILKHKKISSSVPESIILGVGKCRMVNKKIVDQSYESQSRDKSRVDPGESLDQIIPNV
jgi:hypothetical protein